MYHYMVFVSGEPTFGWLSDVGWVGVDLFFVLSGYLIGNQLFAGIVRGERLSLVAFYARRALRTWPAYVCVLTVYFAFPSWLGGKEPPPLWRFITFTQNIGLQPGTQFSHAWSLCIEEQFYLVLPLVFLLARRCKLGRAHAWTMIGFTILCGITVRTLLWRKYGLESSGQIAGYYPNVYYSTVCRFDEFLPGVSVALIKNLHPKLWGQWMLRGQRILIAGLITTAAALYGAKQFYRIDGYGYGFFMTAFGYSLIAGAFALLVTAALSPVSLLQRLRIPGAHSLAVLSYSIYLTHKGVAHVFQHHNPFAGGPAFLTTTAITLTSLAVGAVLYRCVERPFMTLRDRHFPSNFFPSTAPTPSCAER
jgi:peptidoglycan/LPS O-acetylase OafA/YrhL